METFERKLTQTRSKIISKIEEDKAAEEDEESYCEICYTNVIQKPGTPITDLQTVEFECSHRFCSECTIEQLKGCIEKAEIDKLKCFDYECG